MKPHDNIIGLCFPLDGTGLRPSSTDDGLRIHVEPGRTVRCEWQSSNRPDHWIGRDATTGLELERIVERLPEWNAAIIRYRITNSSAQTCTVTGLSVPIDLERGPEPWRLCTGRGGGADHGYPPENYAVREQILYGTAAVRLGTDLDGRSSNRNLPMVIACRADEPQAGIWCGPEWSAEWTMEVSSSECENRVRIATAIGVRRLALAPGETIEFPPIHLGVFRGGLAAGSNALRRYIYQGLQPRYRGQEPYGRVSYCSYFGFGSDINDAEMRRQAKRAAELGIEVFEIDAGYNGVFPQCSGEWADVDRRKFPDGLEAVADYVRSLGMDFGLWIESERAYRGTWAHRQRPELLWPDPAGRDEFLTDLSRREAQDWAIDWQSRWIKQCGASWVRYDQNVPAGIYLNSQDWSRKVQFGYVAGIYRVLDALRERFPDLMIENCASGGRRIDFGTLRRSHTNWMSDYSEDAHTCRWMQLRAQRFLPGNNCNSGIGHLGPGGEVAGHGVAFGAKGLSTRAIDLAFLSRITGKLSIDGDIAQLDAAAVERYRHWIAVHKRIRHLVVQDYYSLLPIPASPEDWDAAQWSAYDGSEGLVLCCRIAGAVSRHIRLVGIKQSCRYRFTSLADGQTTIVSGAELIEPGLPVKVQEADAILFRWEQVRS